MGNSASKGAQAAGKAVSRAGAGKRQYPSTPSLLNQTLSTPAQQDQHQQQPPPSDAHIDDFVDLDARDPHFASSLSRLGPVRRRTPEATRLSPQSTSPSHLYNSHSHSPPPTGQHVFPSRSAAATAINPAIAIVNARDRIARRFEEESEDLGSKAFAGRTLLSAREIREVISAKEQGQEQGRWSDSAIEQRFHLKSGVLVEILSGGAVKNV